MKINKKALDLVEKGLSSKLVSKLSESQVNALHSKIITETKEESNEEIKTQVTNITYDPASTSDQQKLAQKGVHVNPSTKKITMSTTGSGAITTEIEAKEQEESNPWAICTAQLGKEFGTTERSDWNESQLEKYESCIRDVKKSLKENKKEVTSFLENKIMDLVERHLPAKITKSELIKYLSEQKPHTAPKPGVKEPKPGTKTPPKPKPAHPGKNPNPGENPAPKAKGRKIDPEVAKDEILDLIKNILGK